MARKKKQENLADPTLLAQFNMPQIPAEEVARAVGGADVLAELLSGGEDDATAVELGEGELGALHQEFESIAALTLRKAQLEEELSDVSAALQAQKDRMKGAMKGHGTSQFKGDDGAGCTIQVQFDTKLEDPQAFMEWVKERHPELLVVHSQTRTKFIRENFRDQGVAPDSPEWPPGITASERESLVVRGVLKKKAKAEE